MRLVVIPVLIAVASVAIGQQAVVLVRHAEKATDSNEPEVPLSKQGQARAERLAKMLVGAGVTAVYATDTVRARKTGEPLAKALKLEVLTYPSRDASGRLAPRLLFDHLRKDDATGVVLVVGHQNTVPDLLAGLGYTEKIEIGEKDFDDLFVVVPKAGGATVIRLKY